MVLFCVPQNSKYKEKCRHEWVPYSKSAKHTISMSNTSQLLRSVHFTVMIRDIANIMQFIYLSFLMGHGYPRPSVFHFQYFNNWLAIPFYSLIWGLIILLYKLICTSLCEKYMLLAECIKQMNWKKEKKTLKLIHITFITHRMKITSSSILLISDNYWLLLTCHKTATELNWHDSTVAQSKLVKLVGLGY